MENEFPDSDEEESTSAKKIVYATLCDKIPFSDVAGVLDKVADAETGKEKKAKIIKLFDHYRNFYKKEYETLDASAPNTHGDSLYPLVRILLPAEDRGRGAYGFKSFSLGKVFAKILGVHDLEEGKKLTKFKDPTEIGAMAGDFSAVVTTIFKQRFSANETRDGNGPSVTELHEMLDSISKVRGEKDNVNVDFQRTQLKKFITKLKANEIKWLVRILLKRLRLGLTTGLIFQCVHPQAKELYERNSNLEYVCQKLNDPSIPLAAAEINLFTHCQPMLCARLDIQGDTFEADSQEMGTSGKNKVYLPQAPFIVETKWDGERFQIHYNGRKLKYISRKGHDFTKSFDESLTSRLKPQILHGAESFILDGEMMAWHVRRQKFTTKGQNIDVKTMRKDNPNHIPVFVAYDILFYNGEVLTSKPLQFRTNILKDEVIRVKEDIVQVSEQKLVSSKEEVMDALNEAIDRLDEGIIVKDMNSIYEPSKRSTNWLKIKPEYVEGSCPNDMDLLILGVYYSESNVRAGHFTHFLVGVIDDSSGGESFYPVVKLGTGQLKNPEVEKLVNTIQNDLVKTEINSVKYKGRKRPDLFIDPRKSVALQVKASEIIYNDSLEAKYTLRFPVITKVRFDKPWNEVMTLSEFHQLRETFSGKLAMRTDGKDKKVNKWGGRHFNSGAKGKKYFDSDDENKDEQESKPGPSRLMRSATSRSNPTSSTTVSNIKQHTSLKAQKANMDFGVSKNQKKAVQTDVFKGKVFCLYGSAKWTLEMESEIFKYGGLITKSPLKTGMFAIVGENEKNSKVESANKHKIFNVMKAGWIRKCIERKAEWELSPADFWFALPEMAKLFENTHDKYGDSYTEEVTREELKTLLTKMVNADSGSSSSETDMEIPNKRLSMEEIFPDEQQRNKILKYSFFEKMKIAFRGNINQALAAKIEFFGGQVAKDETEGGVTHVVAEDPSSPRKKFHTAAMVVKVKWLEESLAKKEVVEELPYLIT